MCKHMGTQVVVVVCVCVCVCACNRVCVRVLVSVDQSDNFVIICNYCLNIHRYQY